MILNEAGNAAWRRSQISISQRMRRGEPRCKESIDRDLNMFHTIYRHLSRSV